MKPIVCIAGPTASGKTGFAVHLAKAVGGEVINADSMQVYREIQVLSARPDKEEMNGVPHHLFGHISGLDRHNRYSTGEWVRDAIPIILNCLARGIVPILTGGTGLYFKALFQGIAEMPKLSIKSEDAFKDTLKNRGLQGVRDYCFAHDPVSTENILGDDPQRLERIYRVYYETGRPLSAWQVDTHPLIPEKFAKCAVMLPERDVLYDKINKRFDQMVELGGLEEAKIIHQSTKEFQNKTPMMKAIGLSHFLDHLSGDISYERAIELAKRDSRRLAKRQMTWFRNQTPDWPNLTNLEDQNSFTETVKSMTLNARHSMVD